MRQIVVLIFSVALFTSDAAVAQPQDEPQAAGESTKHEAAAPKTSKKQMLTQVTRVSSDEAAKAAAKSVIQKRGDEKPSGDSEDAAVVEFRPTEHTEGPAAGAVVVNPKDPKKWPVQNVHGSVYGSAGAAGNAEGGAVGASSKGGKASIYVESGRSRQSPPPPASR